MHGAAAVRLLLAGIPIVRSSGELAGHGVRGALREYDPAGAPEWKPTGRALWDESGRCGPSGG